VKAPYAGHEVPVTSPDPFARPVLRTPVLHAPLWLLAAVRLCRMTWRSCRFIARHPVACLMAASLAIAWRFLGCLGAVVVAVVVVAISGVWRLAWPGS
jgi:hypothetical protein